ncbi:unnamed protein product, partial [Allacma fusca]
HNRTSQEIDYHYLGFDGKCYLMSNQAVPEKAIFSMDEVSSILYTDQKTLIYCRGLRFFFAEPIQFTMTYKNGTETLLLPGMFTAYQVPLKDPDDANPVEAGILMNFSEDVSEISCYFPLHESSNWNKTSRNITVQRVKAPFIERSDRTIIFYIGDKGRTLICRSDGNPPPTFQWFTNGS